MQVENPMDSSILPDDVDDEEVWLYWIDSNKEPHGKAIRHLAQEAREGTKADLEVLTYYRYWGHSASHRVITGSASLKPLRITDTVREHLKIMSEVGCSNG